MPREFRLDLVKAGVTPAGRRFEDGILLARGRTLPFVVERSWSGPAGNYFEEWSIRKGREVLYRHAPRSMRVRGMQSVSRFEDTVEEPLRMEPGEYSLVFVVEGRYMGSSEIQVLTGSEAAA